MKPHACLSQKVVPHVGYLLFGLNISSLGSYDSIECYIPDKDLIFLIYLSIAIMDSPVFLTDYNFERLQSAYCSQLMSISYWFEVIKKYKAELY